MSADLTTVSKLLEEDRLRMKLAEETNARLVVERQNMNYQIAQLSARARKHAEEKAALGLAIGQKYGLKPNDEVDVDNGEITRAPIAKPTEPPTVPFTEAMAGAGKGVPQPHPSLKADESEPAADPHPNGAVAPTA